MKTAAKVFIIIGMILGAIAIYPIILGIFSIRALDNAKSQKDLTTWGVVTLLFVSLLGGIFMLLIKDEDLNDNFISAPTSQYKNTDGCNNQTHTTAPIASNTDSLNQAEEFDDIILAELYDEL